MTHASGWYVVKIGGELALDRPALAASVGRAVRRFLDDGHKVVIVHGGGPQATELTRRVGLTTSQVHGQRVTDEATLEIMKLALGGVGVDVAAAMRLAGVEVVATSGVSGGLVDASRRPPVELPTGETVDYGLVGDITHVNVSLLERLAAAGVVPVLGCLAGDASGRIYNVNADTVATRVAERLNARRLFLVSNVPGVLRDRHDPSSRIPSLTLEAARRFIAEGVISGGMIPKVEESLAVLEEGVEAIHIVGIVPPAALLEEAEAPGRWGTVITPEGPRHQ